MRKRDEIIINVGGAAGQGIMSIGHVIAKTLQRHGYNIFVDSDYPSLIRGGHNTIRVRASKNDIFSQIEKYDVLIAMNPETVMLHADEIRKDGIAIFDNEYDTEKTRDDIEYAGIPAKKIAKDTGSEILEGSVVIGFLLKLLGLQKEKCTKSIRDNFRGKDNKVIENNIEAFNKGYEIKTDIKINLKLEKAQSKDDILIDGNHAITLGAIKSGMKFLAQYPMTPATSILINTAKYEEEYGIVVKQVEDEPGVINMAIGASFAGVRSMCATSGGGFSLMTEAVGLAASSETPLVIVQAQRAGTSTGLPTYTEQSDLRQVLHASQSDAFRVVVAPGDSGECFYDAFDSFNIAERIQCPVIILTDKYLGNSMMTVKMPDTENLRIDRGKMISSEELSKKEKYLRYELTKDNISPRAVPGQKNGQHICSSYEHDETGFTSEDPEDYIRQKEKRLKKFRRIPDEIIAPKLYGKEGADVLIVCWGSTKMPAIESLNILSKSKIDARVMHVHYLSPFPSKEVLKELKESKNLIVVEGNATSLLGGLIREKTGFRIKNKCMKHDGRPVYPEDIADAVKQMLGYGKIETGYTNPGEVD